MHTSLWSSLRCFFHGGDTVALASEGHITALVGDPKTGELLKFLASRKEQVSTVVLPSILLSG